METIGRITLEVRIDKEGCAECIHDAKFSEELSLMMTTLSDDEARWATELRKIACQAAAQFFTYIRDPAAAKTLVVPVDPT